MLAKYICTNSVDHGRVGKFFRNVMLPISLLLPTARSQFRFVYFFFSQIQFSLGGVPLYLYRW